MRHTLGHSGAIIDVHDDYVVKRGWGVSEQARYVEQVLSYGGPTILAVGDSMYVMGRLHEPDPRRQLDLMREIRALLERWVWSQAPLDPHGWLGWRHQLLTWAQDLGYGALGELCLELYREPDDQFRGEVCAIHGDPTLANAMRRGNRTTLIDPIPPRGKIPPLREVDLGKLLQSALGWENLLDPAWPEGSAELQALATAEFDESEKVWFWGAVHCLRIIPYASSARVIEWARENYEKCDARCRELKK